MKESKLAIILALAALDDSAIKSLEERVNELAELGFKPEIVEELPESGNDHTLYLVPQNEPGENPWYKEYLWLDNEWENIGTTSINFENYELKSNKVTTLDDQSTDDQYPSAKAAFDAIKDVSLTESHFNKSTQVYIIDDCIGKGWFYKQLGYPFKYKMSASSSNTQDFYNGNNIIQFCIFNDYKDIQSGGSKVVGYFYTSHHLTTGVIGMGEIVATNNNGMYSLTIGSNFNLAYAMSGGAQTFQGVKTFSSLPVSTPVPTQDGQLTNKKYVDEQISAANIQYNIMPTANASNENQIIEYIGTTDANYTQGYFYKCISDGAQEPTYSWERVDVQPNGSIDTYIIDIGDYDLDDLVNMHNIPYDNPLYLQLEDFAKVLYAKNGHLDIYLVNNNDNKYQAHLVRATGTFDDDPELYGNYQCDLEIIDWTGTYSFSRIGGCTTSSSNWYFSVNTLHEFTDNKVININGNNTNNQYPSAKAVWDLVSSVNNMPIYRYFTNSNTAPFDFTTAEPGLYIPDYNLATSTNFYYIPGNGTTVGNYPCHMLFFVIYQKYQATTPVGGYRIGEGYCISPDNNSTGSGRLSMLDFYNTTGRMSVYIPFSTKYRFVSESAQQFDGVKTFAALPQIKTYSAPTADVQFTPKRYVDDKISSAIASLETLKRVIVETLPVADIDPNTIYMVLKTVPGLQNIYDEWMYINNEWELIGSTEVDLSNYLAKDNTTIYTPTGQYNPATKGYVDNHFFKGYESSWNLLTPEQQAAFAVAIVEYGLYDLTEEDESNLSSILGSEEPIISDMTEGEGIEITNEIIGGNN